MSADRVAATGTEVDSRGVNCVIAGNRIWAVRAARMLRDVPVQSLPEQVRSPLPPWDTMYFREPFYFLTRAPCSPPCRGFAPAPTVAGRRDRKTLRSLQSIRPGEACGVSPAGQNSQRIAGFFVDASPGAT